MKAGLAIVRLIMMYFFYYLDNFFMTKFLQNLIGFLLIHESLVLLNSFIVNINEIISNFMSRQVVVPSICNYLDLFNNL
jgi:hypothetical protein